MAGSANHILAEYVPTARKNNANWAHVPNDALCNPFAEGSFRYCALGAYTHGRRAGQPCVLKWFKSGVVFEEVFFQKDLKAVEKARHIIEQWNAMWFIGKYIRLNIPSVWTRQTDGQKALIEPFIPDWEKFNSNTGWYKDGMQWGRVMQALSHYSYHLSSGQFVLCDLQGGISSNGVVLSDPVILSRSRSYGVTDLGADGIRNFFGHHTCNEFCRRGWTMPHDAARLFPPKEGTSMEHQPVATRPSRQPMTPLYEDFSEDDDYF